ncbi:BTAD domain-containing putative transcriptional regulator [Kribbella sp. NPDC058693]|uniref:AfsR/SARP family transcriptional regulator n=1 Tax=Kribbella sp. NPDC058693 TaxID=3346602 RepID=UPI003662EA17
MQLRVLGALEVWVDGERTGLDAARQRGVLALLAVRPGAPASRDWLIDQLWCGTPPPSARTTLQSCVYRLRRRFEGSALRIESRPDGYVLEVPAGESDLSEYERLVAAGRTALDSERLEEAVGRFREALALWSGDFLADVDLPAVRERAGELEEGRLEVLETCLQADLELGRHSAVVPELQALVARHPLRELPWQLLMTALSRAGRRAEALDTYQRLWRVLDEQLGVQPSAAAQELQARILAAGEPEPAPTRQAPVPHQLPAGLPGFVGRGGALKRLDEYLDRFRTRPAAGLCVVTGPAGIGKTTLAVHWARQIADRFPDGQLYADLQGFDPSGRTANPGTTLARFLTALGTPPDRVPADLEAGTAALRSLLEDRRVLLVLDNVRSAEHVRPLLAGGPGCLTVVTSRDRLAGLMVTEQAAAVTLEPFGADAARLLLEARIGPERFARERTASDELVAGCAGLPLALAVVAALADLHPSWPLASLATELRRNVLDALSAGDPATDARAVFSWSYRSLSPAGARLFRLLGVHPGPDLDVAEAAALAGVTAAEVQPLLDELCRSHQLTETAPGWYAMHDLLRSYSIELAEPGEAQAALGRLLDLLVRTGYAAARIVSPTRDAVSLQDPDPTVVVDPPATRAAAMDWFAARQRTLVGLTYLAGFDEQVWRLAWLLYDFLDYRGDWNELIALHERALAAVTRLGIVTEEARAHRNLARINLKLRRLDAALAEEQQALDLSRSLGDLTGEAHAYIGIGRVLSAQGHKADAVVASREAQGRYLQVGHRSGHAMALNNEGWDHAALGDYERAIVCCEEALAELREIGELDGESDTLDSLGFAYARLGRHDDALRCYRRVIELEELLGRRHQLAESYASTGDIHETIGEHATARDYWIRAAGLFEELDHPNAAVIRAKLG